MNLNMKTLQLVPKIDYLGTQNCANRLELPCFQTKEQHPHKLMIHVEDMKKNRNTIVLVFW